MAVEVALGGFEAEFDDDLVLRFRFDAFGKRAGSIKRFTGNSRFQAAS